MKNDFHQFVREEFGQSFSARSYRRKGGSFERSQNGVRAIATFFRYHDRLRPLFNVRLQIALADFSSELGAVLLHDLSTMIGRGSRIDEWRWPLLDDDRRRISTKISEALGSKGLPWLEACLDPSQLTACLESQKRFTPEDDDQQAAIMAALSGAGAAVAYQSEGFSAPRAGKFRPNTVKALSFCYQLSEQWERALTAWDDYAAIFAGRFPRDHPEEVALRERRAFLAARCGGGLPHPNRQR